MSIVRNHNILCLLLVVITISCILFAYRPLYIVCPKLYLVFAKCSKRLLKSMLFCDIIGLGRSQERLKTFIFQGSFYEVRS